MGGLLQIGFLTSFRRSNVITIALGVFAAAIAVYPADVSYAAPDQENQAPRSRATRESGSNPPYAAMVLDVNSASGLGDSRPLVERATGRGSRRAAVRVS